MGYDYFTNMKAILVLYSFFFSFVLNAQTKGIEFIEIKKDFGQVREWKNDVATFYFINNTGQTIRVLPTQASFDLEVIYPKEPVPPGGSGKIEAIYYTDRPESFLRKFPIYFSHDANPTTLEVKGSIYRLHKDAFISCPSMDAKPEGVNTEYLLDVQVVDDATDLPIKNASVILAVAGKEIARYKTNTIGSFEARVQFGYYQIFAQASGYQTKIEGKDLNSSLTFYQIRLKSVKRDEQSIIQNQWRDTAAMKAREIASAPFSNLVDTIQKPLETNSRAENKLPRPSDTIVRTEVVFKTDTVIEKQIMYARDTFVQTNTIVKKDTLVIEKRSIDTVFVATKADDSENSLLKKQLESMQKQLEEIQLKMKEQEKPINKETAGLENNSLDTKSEIDTKTGMLNNNIFKPNNIVFVLDISGSMEEGNKLKHMKSSLKKLIDVLRPNDRISIITYNLNAYITLPSCNVSDKGRIHVIIDSLKAFGLTNGVKGLEKAYDFLEHNFIADGNNQVIMITDGKFTKSDKDEEQMFAFVNVKALNQMKLTVVGMGNDRDAFKRMKKLAESGKGNLIAIENVKLVTDNILIDEVKTNSKK